MKTIRLILASALLAWLSVPLTSQADDIDIYNGIGSTNGTNVMIVMDNAANSDANMGSCTYWDGTSPSGGSKSMGNYQCALANIVHSMSKKPDGSALLNLGMTDMNGLFIPLTPIDDKVFTGTLPSYATYTVPAGTTNRQAFIIAVKALAEVPGKVGQGAEMQETWAYYTGGNGGTTGTGILSGTTYSGTNATTGCQKNFAIFLSGVKANASHALENGELPALTASVNNAVSHGVITSAQGTALLTPLAGKPEAGYGIEWARFMLAVDDNSGASGTQSIITYSLATGNTAVPITSSMEKYIQDVGNYGGGKYFAAGTDGSVLTNDILKILNEVQAVNSVFSSSSLPVSVNAQGTYLNQIYMGMFRPDASASPRWLGNLKQFQFILDNNGIPRVADSLGQLAISSAGTGFITPNAVSFWTKKDLTVAPDLDGGFWRNQPTPNGVGGAYDSPDGELVEKGGAAQQLRLANLNDTYTSGSTLTRNLYTYCPNGSSCVNALSDPKNSFSRNNTLITAAMFGGSSTLTVSSIVRTGTTALVTTSGSHGFSAGDTVTISGANQSEYNVTQTLTSGNINSGTTFTITGLPDYPTTPSAGTYTASLHNSSAQTVTSIVRPGASTASNTETATVTTAAAHGYSSGTSVTITGASPANYNGTVVIATVPTPTSFTYSLPVYPTRPAVNSYKAVLHPYTRTISTVSGSNCNETVTTSAAHGFHVGQAITITGTGVAKFDTGQTVLTVPSPTTFTFSCSGNPGNTSGGSVSPSATAVTLSSVTRTSNAVSTTATAAGLTAGTFANGDLVDITTTGVAPNEGAYVVSGVAIACANTSGPCTGTTFTYPITATPALSATTAVSGTPIQVGLATTPVPIAAGNLTRTASGMVTATGITASTFTNGASVDIATSGTVLSHESAYTGTWTIACSGTCTSFTYGPVTLTPTTPATGSQMTVYKGSSPPDPTSLISWVRGEDNFGDELSPTTSTGAHAYTVRPSIHADVLHSRPVVINYGGSIGVVAYYGTNDGVFHAVNGNQTADVGSGAAAVKAGGELWGLVLPEFFDNLTRQRTASPALLLPSTPAGIVPTPLRKDYFVDGATGVYQKLNADGTINTAYLYLTMRRGGNFIYALDVTDPTNPLFKWKIKAGDTGFEELGQTWSRPRIALINANPNPVLIFGGGYDAVAEDAEPPTADTMGRGIYVIDAFTGAKVWSAEHATVTGMDYAFPSDITMLDRDFDGKTDRLYATDVGGNVWRADIDDASTSNWKVTKLAALGCDAGVCAAGTVPRKFFYPPSVIPIGPAGASGSYDVVLIGSGDREHPLYSTATNSAYNVANRFYVLKDLKTGKDATGQVPITQTGSPLFHVTTTVSYVDTLTSRGYYFDFAIGEKDVNGPLTSAGVTYFGTNQPSVPSATSCTANLGVARGYALNPFSGTFASTVLDGGGMPPTAVAGITTIAGKQIGFCIGCVTPAGIQVCDANGLNCFTTKKCNSNEDNCSPDRDGAKKLNRTYWYKK